jgi:molecular chaperone Hsp33
VAPYRRCLWEDAGLLVVAGDFARALLSRDAYNARYGISPPAPRNAAVLGRALAATGLAALSLAERESWGWSMSFAGESAGLFCAVEPEGMVCGRVIDAEPAGGLIALQRQQPGEPAVESRFEPVGGDPVRAIERYFELSMQTPTRIAVNGAGPGALVQVIPGGDFARVAALDDDDLLSLVEGLSAADALKVLDEVLLFYECRCDDQMVLEMVRSLSGEQQAEVWGDADEIEVECPRCAREFVVKRRMG